ncbi:ABC transporter ATP-binding protein [Virgibacillus halodenitrificans]|uniref:ABC transporter ATP-binding protein n=1 Tax=Virgibacillus halodenitrificans TaxID=1482 RepID=UPI0002F16919|nr:dipeptide ABC transporter ATP-binding protein [Virgibacillus halodenitrificans]MYL44493.1 dipeptide ABC transporter ATP-binding protein [Virgibacillus halodenitrificans]WHX25637.1 dipeptide ABC transporter ATP-binding protein [Virgibacillus halodenitrificans]
MDKVVDKAQVTDTTVLQVKGLKQYFPVKKEKIRQEKQYVKAVDDISFAIEKGTTLSIVGESGCGKSTTGRAILRLEEPTDGEILYKDTDLAKISKRQLKKVRGEIQVIFQDPFASLNPRRTIRKMLNEAMEIQQVGDRQNREARMLELMSLVGLPPDSLERLPHEFSGGQRQRIGIARALSVNPEVIICDEAVSALDVSIQAQIINLLKKLQKQFNLTYVFISHDLSVVRHISDRVMVMYLGKIVEIADKKDLFDKPLHPYTKALLSAIPTTDLDSQRKEIEISGDVPSPINPPSGCRFHTRCPFATEKCRQEEPSLQVKMNGSDNHLAACHYADEIFANS